MASQEENISESHQHTEYNVAYGNEQPSLNQPHPAGSNVYAVLLLLKFMDRLYYGISVAELKRLTQLRKKGETITLDLYSKPLRDPKSTDNPIYHPTVDYSQQGQMHEQHPNSYMFQQMPPNGDAFEHYDESEQYY